MSVTSFLMKVDFRLIAHEQLVSAIAELQLRSIVFVGIAQTNAMEVTTDECRYAIGGTVGHTSVEHLVIVGVLHPGCHIHPVDGTVVLCQH